jgi:hypothetical protein
VVGNLGSGKTLLLTFLGVLEMTEGKQIYSTYHISFETEDGHKPMYVDVGDLSQWMSRQAKVGMFAPHSGILLLDEGYAGMDSRTSSSIANRLLSHFIFQSRKLGLDLFVSAQLASSLDKRVRGLCDAWILAELQPRDTVDKNGNVTLSVDDFRYTYAGVDGSFGEFVLAHEDAEKIFPYYSTMEIIQPPMIVLDKKAGLEAKRAMQQIGLAARKAQPSQIRAPPTIPEQTELADAPHAKPKIRRKLV